MKQIQVRKVPYGETFSVFGDKFVALDYINGNVLAIRKEIWKTAPFDTGGVNDLRTASITGHLVQYFEDLCKNGASEDTIAMNTMDLKATDGSREYGTFGMRAGLLTLEQYGKYQDHYIFDILLHDRSFFILKIRFVIENNVNLRLHLFRLPP